jgi:hypothetical protein
MYQENRAAEVLLQLRIERQLQRYKLRACWRGLGYIERVVTGDDVVGLLQRYSGLAVLRNTEAVHKLEAARVTLSLNVAQLPYSTSRNSETYLHRQEQGLHVGKSNYTLEPVI